nr:tetratricopeptide repeat protein [Rickettsia endosymbiont of Ceutorhynchus assimilis]
MIKYFKFLFSAFLPSNSKTDLYFADKGDELLNLGKYELAIEAYNKAIELNPDNQDYYHNKVLAITRLYEEDLAVNLAPEAIFQNFYSIKANMFNTEGKYDLALETIDKCIELEPENFYSYYNKARILYDSKQYALALINFNKAIELNPNNSGLYYNKAMALAHLGKYNLALEAINKAIELKPLNFRLKEFKEALMQELEN